MSVKKLTACPKHVFLDLDGVLIDSEILYLERDLRTIRQTGINYPFDEYAKKYTGVTSEMFDHLLDTDVRLKELSSSSIALLRQKIIDDPIRILNSLDLIDDTRALLKFLGKHFSVVTNSSQKRVDDLGALLNFAGLAECKFFTSCMVKRPKPSPDIYLLAIQKLEIMSEDVIAIEDSVAGVLSATAAGLTVIGFVGTKSTYSDHERDLLSAGVDFTVSSHKELISCLKQIGYKVETNRIMK